MWKTRDIFYVCSSFLKHKQLHNFNCKYFSTEAELLDIFSQNGPPKYDKVLEPMKELDVVPKKKQAQEKDLVITCNRSELNHYRNQKYDPNKPIPLASKGWNHYKSKGDFFKIHIFNEEYNTDDIFYDANSFNDLKLDPLIVSALDTMQIVKPTKIQAESLPILLSGKNSIIAAETGCGKTLAYLVPIIQQILKWKENEITRPPNSPLALIMCPSRELAIQIHGVAQQLCHQLPFRCNLVIGGSIRNKMLNPDVKYVDLQIATPGAISKLTTTQIYDMKYVRHLVLDEADTMLDDSFNEHLLRFMKKFNISNYQKNNTCQLTLVSATKAKSINEILSDLIEPDSFVKITSQRLHMLMPHVPQIFYRLGGSNKASKLLTLAKARLSQKIPTIIFSNRAPTCDWISLMLHENGVPALNLNGDMPRILRQGKFKEFQDGATYILSCTDIASRGLNTNHVKTVINYDFPLYMADYIHRCGRTGRVGSPKDCEVINFVSGEREIELVNKIEMAARTMQELPNVNGNITKIIKHRISRFESNKNN